MNLLPKLKGGSHHDKQIFMIYFGLRSTATYLASLDEVRKESQPFHLTSVIGGAAFLHALSEKTTSLTLIDSDPDALLHWGLISELIQIAESLEEFYFFICGYYPNLDFTPNINSTNTQNRASHPVRARLSPRYDELYQRTYLSVVVDPSSGIGHIGDGRIYYTGFDLSPQSYCWHFGKYNFKDNDSFLKLKTILKSVSPEILCTELQSVHYGKLAHNAKLHIVLASNCESPLFTKGDAILEQVVRTSNCRTRYVSWHRDITIEGNDFKKENKKIVSINDFLLDDYYLLSTSDETSINARFKPADKSKIFTSLELLSEFIGYGRELLIIAGYESDEILNMIKDIAPTFKRIILLGKRVQNENEYPDEIYTRYLMFDIKEIEGVLFELRGLRPKISKI